MDRVVDWSKWRRTLHGYARVAPAAGPCGHRWTDSGPGQPWERSVECTCTIERRHLVWVCPTCGMYCAEGCIDVAAWERSTVPGELPMTRRATI
jgi:hypothetical protein